MAVTRAGDDGRCMHPLLVTLLEGLLAAAARSRLTFTTAERRDLEVALVALERRRYALEDSAVCERIAALQSSHGLPVSGAP